MIRYLRLYGYFVRFSVSRALEFRLDFFFRIAMDLFYYGMNLAFFKLVYLHTGLLGGWTESQALIFVSGYLVLDGISMTLFSNNLWWLPTFVNRGDLDYYLLRPVSSLFFMSLRDFATNSLVNLVMAVGIMVWAIARYEVPIPAPKIALFVLLILNGTYLNFLVRMMTLIPVFWLHSSRGLDQAFWPLSKLMERPDRIYTGWVRRLLTTVVPFSLMASFPARLVLEPFDWNVLGIIAVVTLVFTIAVSQLWKRGLRSYSSASS